MPEGPEAKTIAEKIRPILKGHVILSAQIGDRAKINGFNYLKFPHMIIETRSYGKKVIIELSRDVSLVVSLAMTGRLQYSEGKHSHIKFEIYRLQESGMLNIYHPVCNLYFDDTRYMGHIDVVATHYLPVYFKDIGPDLLHHSYHEEITLDRWLTIFKQKKIQNKMMYDVLVNQDLVAGIGWYLMTEILYHSQIHPFRISSSLSDDDWNRVRIESHRIIKDSYEHGGLTIQSYISPDGIKGTYPVSVYKKDSDKLGNTVIHQKLKNGRTVHFVPSIQI